MSRKQELISEMLDMQKIHRLRTIWRIQREDNYVGEWREYRERYQELAADGPVKLRLKKRISGNKLSATVSLPEAVLSSRLFLFVKPPYAVNLAQFCPDFAIILSLNIFNLHHITLLKAPILRLPCGWS